MIRRKRGAFIVRHDAVHVRQDSHRALGFSFAGLQHGTATIHAKFRADSHDGVLRLVGPFFRLLQGRLNLAILLQIVCGKLFLKKILFKQLHLFWVKKI